MTDDLVVTIFFIAVVVAAADIVRRSLLAVMRLEKIQSTEKEMRRLRKPVQPHVTVLVYERNQPKALERTLRSLKGMRYHFYDVVVVRDRLLIKNDQAIRDLFGEVAFLRRRKIGSKLDAYRAAYRKSRKGEVVVCAEAGQLFDRFVLKRAVAERKSRPQWRSGLVAVATNKATGIIAVGEEIHEVFRIFGVASLSVFSAKRFLSLKRAPVQAWADSVPVIELALFLLIGVGVVYAGGIALWYGWLLFSGYVLALAWVSVESDVRDKIKISFSSISSLFFLPVASLMQGFSQLSKRK